MGAWSIWHWLVVLLIVILVFGTKKLKNIGQDLGGAVKGFKDGMKDGSQDSAQSGDAAKPIENQAGNTIEGQATKEQAKS